MNISIVIPSFNGKHLLEKYLPSVLTAIENYSSGKTELIVVDDGSEDDTENYLKLNFHSVKVLRREINRGFSSAANYGIFSAAYNIVVLLNNDLEISKDFLYYLQEHFEDKDIFAVRPGLKNTPEEEILENPKIGGGFKYGIFDVPKVSNKEMKYAFFAGGGAATYDKKKFVELGGFDEIFSPFYYEDVDLSYRAWKRGWKIIYEPRSQAYHRGGATIFKYYKNSYINTISERNKYFLVWKNITSKNLLLKHLAFIPIRIIVSILKCRFTTLIGFFYALCQLNEVTKKRKTEKQAAKMTDREIFNMFK